MIRKTITLRDSSLLILLALFFFPALVLAQEPESSQYDHGTPPQHAAGVSALGSYLSTDLGTINLANGSLNSQIPLGNVGGRGFSLPITLNYSSKVWSSFTGTDIVTEPIYRTYKAAVAVYESGEGGPDIYQRVAPGWTLGAVPTLRVRGVGIIPVNNPPCGALTDYLKALTKLTLMLPDKGEIELRDDVTNGSPLGTSPMPPNNCRWMDGNRGQRWHATDGSGIIFISDVANGVVNGNLNGWLITSDGTRYRFDDTASGFGGSVNLNEFARASSIIDRNGNRVQITYSTNPLVVTYTDQLGHATTIEYGVIDPATGETLAARVTLPGYGGQSRQYKLRTGVMNQNYRAGINPTLPVYNGFVPGMAGYEYCGGPPPSYTALFASWCGGAERIDDRVVLTQVVLPDNRALKFRYTEYGEVAEIEMPTGGKVQYDYAYENGMPSGNSPAFEVNPSPGPGNVAAIDRAVKTRRIYPDGVNVEAYWSYEYTATSGGNGAASNGVAEVIARASDNSTVLLRQKHYFLNASRFLDSSGGTGYSLWSTSLERRGETLNAGGASISASEQDWSQRTPVVWSFGYPSQQIQNDNRVNEERSILETGQTARTTTLFDLFNNPIETSEYDFDSTLKRRTVISYSSTNLVNGVNYAGDSIRLIRLPLQQSVYDGAGVEQARTITEYDIYTGDGNHDYLLAYASVSGHDTVNYGVLKTTRGNATRIGGWIKSSNTYLYTYPRYDILGNVVSGKDARGNVSTISFADDFGDGSNPGSGANNPATPTYSLPTLITSPPPNAGDQPHTARSQYDFSTGLLTGFKDRNNIVTQTIYNDPFNRPTLVKSALGVTGVENHAAIYYAPATALGITLAKNDVLTAKDQTTLGDATLRSWTVTDGFGRTKEGWSRDPQGDVKVVTNYDALGRAIQTSNPFRPSLGETALYTTTAFDLAGRVTSFTTPDNAVVSTSYSGNQVTVTDQAGKARRSVTDGLGRLITVFEDPSGANLQTSYSYDVLDNLTMVSQGVQTRSFVYDSLKRLTLATNPESGTVSYDYDNNGNLLHKTDARNNTTTLAYDALNRVTSKSYNDNPKTPPVNYYYDSQTLPSGAPSFTRGASTGRLVAVTYGSGSSAGTYRGYDEMGRVVRQYQRTDSVNYLVEASYYASGSMQNQTYPSVPGYVDRRTVTYTPDVAGRLGSLNSNATSYAPSASVSTIGYASHNAVNTETYGNSLVHAITYNSRLQADGIKLGTSGNPTSVLNITYNYGTTNNNGNVQGIGYSGGGLNYTQTFGYDALNRLTTSVENSGSSWSQTNGHDRYGNRWIDLGGGNQNLTFSTSTNRITTSGHSYDAAGNLLNDTIHTYTFDAENKISKVDSVTAYTYDGESQRVRKLVGENTRFVYGIGGQLIMEFDGSTGNLRKEYVYAGGTMATIEPNGKGSPGTQYTTTDTLGTPRVVTNSSGSVVGRHDYMPFGEELGAGVGGRTVGMGFGAVDGVRQKFTSKERDNEAGLDYFGVRYYASTQGRFTGADPLFIEMKRLAHPQAWNLYAYTRNNPLKYVDDDGMEVKVDCGASDGKNFKQCVQQTTTDLNNRKGAQFKTEIKDGKLGVVGKVDVSTLSKSEAALYNAITDTKNVATLTIQMPGIASTVIMFDQYTGRGSNTVDRADLNQLNKLDKSLGGEVIAHAAMEAYVGVAEGLGTYEEAHARANQFFGDVKVGGIQGLPAGAAMATSGRTVYDFRRVGTKATVEKTFITPQPAQSLPNNWERTRGHIRVIVPAQEKKR